MNWPIARAILGAVILCVGIASVVSSIEGPWWAATVGGCLIGIWHGVWIAPLWIRRASEIHQ